MNVSIKLKRLKEHYCACPYEKKDDYIILFTRKKTEERCIVKVEGGGSKTIFYSLLFEEIDELVYEWHASEAECGHGEGVETGSPRQANHFGDSTFMDSMC